MKLPIALLSLFALAACGAKPAAAESGADDSMGAADAPAKVDVYALSADSLDGERVALQDYRGKVTLLVNVASECGYTPQYKGLQALHAEWQDKGFAVLGFPSNEFGGQEPGSAEEIRAFCTDKFGVTFPMFAKVETKAGDGQSPVYAALTKATGEQPKWNFCKYLVGKDGQVLGFYPSGVAPDDAELRAAITAALN